MRALIFLQALILIFLVGCIPFERKEYIDIPNVHVGSQGLELAFFQANPFDEVYENSYFVITIDLANKGAYDIENGVYSIALPEQYAGVSEEKVGRFSIRGKSIFNPQGEIDRLNFRALTKSLDPQLERLETTITFNACYRYKTDASIITCVDTDIEGLKRNKVCITKQEAFPRGQGAPVAIRKIEPRMLPHEDPNRVSPQFAIYIRNLGKGQVVNENKLSQACTGRGLLREDFDVVNIRAYLSDTQLSCRTTEVKLGDSDTRIVCTDDYGIDKIQGTYTAPLRVEIGYGYTQSISKEVVILKQAKF